MFDERGDQKTFKSSASFKKKLTRSKNCVKVFKPEVVVEWQTRYFEGVVSLARVRSSRIDLTI